MFFGALYTESLFLLGTAGAFYHFSRQQFGRAALWGLLVGPDAAQRRAADASARPARSWPGAARTWIERKALAAAVGRLVSGLVDLRAVHLAADRRSARVLASGQIGLGPDVSGARDAGVHISTRSWPMRAERLRRHAGIRRAERDRGAVRLATVWPVTRRLGLAYGLFMVVNIVPALANGGLLSAGRFSSVLFPAFIWLATAIPPSQRAGWIASFAALQAFGAALFYTWRPLF